MTDTLTLFLCGDVMTGRGIDQILPHPSDPLLREPYVRDARRYVELAADASGQIEMPVDFNYIWGDALEELEAVGPDLRIVNLETAVTQAGEGWPEKQIHYRMNPENMPCLTVAGIDCCAVANNHILDWGPPGMAETLANLHKAGIATAGAGARLREAEAPAMLTPARARGADAGVSASEVPDAEAEEGEPPEDESAKAGAPEGLPGKVLVFAYGSGTAGVPRSWEATLGEPGLAFLPNLADETVEAISQKVWAARSDGDVVIFSVHWEPNWGYYVPPQHRTFARRLIDEAGVDIVYGHSSHHVKGLEVYRNKLILYGCGDFINDYEGIGGYERFRSDLTLMYFPQLDMRSGELTGLRLVPMQTRRMRLQRPSRDDIGWLQTALNRESGPLGLQTEVQGDGSLRARW